MTLLQPKEIEITTLDGVVKAYVISRFPAVAGREIVAKYPLTAVPKAGDYAGNEEVMLKLMAYVAVKLPNNNLLQLTTRALVDNHVPDFETLVRIEIEMMRYNTSFFGKGEISTFLSDTAKKVIVSISPTLTPLLERLFQVAKQRLENLKKTTP